MIRVVWPLPGPLVWVPRVGRDRRPSLILAPIVVALWLVAAVCVLAGIGFWVGWRVVCGGLRWQRRRERVARQHLADVHRRAVDARHLADWADYWDACAARQGLTGPNPYRGGAVWH